MPYDVTRTTLQDMTHIPPPAEELRLLDWELWQLDARRAQLLARRAWLVATLHPAQQQPPAAPPRPEATAPRVQNVLLLLGGILLTLAATAFTLVSWRHLGVSGRALVLAAVTAAVLAAPLPLLKRGLRSTAESVAGLGLALTVLDAYALYEVAFAGADGTRFAAASAALLAGLWAAYGFLPRTREMRLPLPAALAAAQLPLFLWAIAVDASWFTITAALLATAGSDTVVALRASARSVRLVALGGAYGLGGWSVMTAGWLCWTATGPSAAARAAALLLLAATLALGAASQAPSEKQAKGLALTSGLLVVAAVGGALRPALPDAWTVPVHLACGLALLAATTAGRLPEAVRQGMAWASAAVQSLAVLWALPVVAVALLGPVGWAEQVWSGAPDSARDAVTVETPWPPDTATAPLVLAAVAGVLTLAVREAAWRSRALDASLTLAWASALAVPATLQLPYTATLLIQGALTAALLLLRRPTATVLALVTSLSLTFLALASEPATLATLASLTALFATAVRRPLPAAATLAYATALAVASGAALELRPEHTALLVLLVPAAAALLAAHVDEKTTTAVEVTGTVAGLVAVALSASEPPMLALVLALAGVIAAATALRSDRRAAGYVAAALFVLATWVRLASWDITTPEAYTLPVTVPALLIGALRRQRDPQTSSWTAYAPGLTATLVPSLFAVWAGQHGPRPLLLGTAALLITLLGARNHLQAPLVLGGTILTLDALHELAPYIVEMTTALPRWAPPALAGILLLALGATYERRIRDVRRVREVLGRMN
ncbi:SCO7613 C-terminal domain-containing membrane protein [Streptomyces sp. NBC_00445]|uniref:SCO7613 C-terminal domain-containing membrane protein n=1 Tax=Streptomyces sp. NBC_00445 TaxID=2975745 RepID=UPI003FCCFF38